MWRRRWKLLGKLASDEGFPLTYGNKSVTYTDDRVSSELGFEDGDLLPPPHQIKGEAIELSASNVR